MLIKHYITSFIIAMLAITNPFGNLAIFIGLTAGRTNQELRRIAITTGISVAIVLIVTIWTGEYILKIFGISLPAFQVAGGIIITIIGLSMLNSKHNGIAPTNEPHENVKSSESIAVVPLAIPIVAGPGAIATVITMIKSHHTWIDKFRYSGASITIALIVGATFYFSPVVAQALREAGLKIVSRIMGMMLVAIAIQITVSGISTLFPVLLR